MRCYGDHGPWQVHQRISGDDGIELVPVLINLGSALMSQGDAAGAEQFFTRSHNIRSGSPLLLYVTTSCL